MKIKTTTRPVTTDDIPALAQLMNSSTLDRHNTQTTNESQLRAWLGDVSPEDLATTYQLVSTETGELVGFAYLEAEPPFVVDWDEPAKEEENTAEESKEETAVDHWSLDKAEEKAYFNTPGLCFVARDGDKVVGSCLCNAKTVEFPNTGRLGSLSILPAWRKRGIGQALTQQALTAFYQQGITHIVTDTDGDSFTSAYNNYLKAGMTIFRHEDIFEKEIRAGKDLLKRDYHHN